MPGKQPSVLGWLRRSAPVTEQDSPALPDQPDQSLQAPKQSQLPSIISAEQLKNLRNAKKSFGLTEACKIFDEKALKLHQVRWLCRGQVCKRTVMLMKPLLVHYKGLNERDNHPL